jgi:hypothetical protein
MTGRHDPAASGLGRLRAGYADREQVIETLKNAFVDGRLTKDELDPDSPGSQNGPLVLITLMIVLAVGSLWTALGIMGYAVFTSWDERGTRPRTERTAG